MSLSVVICTLGRESCSATVESVLASLDAAGAEGEVVLVWQAQAPPPPQPERVRALHVLPAGLSYARNRGIAAARADRIAFVDDDEVVSPTWAAGALGGFEDGADAVFGPVEPMDDLGRPYCLLEGDTARWISASERPWGAGTGGNMAATRAALAGAGNFDLRMGAGSFGRSGEDTFLIAALQRSGARLRWRPEMTVRHPTKTDAEVLASRYPYGFGAGRVMRRVASPRLAAKYVIDIGWAVERLLRTRDRTAGRELAATVRGFTAGCFQPDRWRAPVELLDRLPDELRPALRHVMPAGRAVPHRRDPHFLYAGAGLVLHVYAEANEERREALRAREVLAARAPSAPVPRLLAAVETPSELWVLEDLMPGSPARPSPRPEWWRPASDMLVALGRATGGPLSDGVWWGSAVRLPEDLGPWEAPVAAALQRLGGSPSVVSHGDAQPKNLVIDGDRAALVDWDGALAEGPQGLDLLFLAVTARSGGPDPEPLVALAAGRDVEGLPLLRPLAAAGVEDPKAAALLAAGTWAVQEARGQGPGPYAALLARVAPLLAQPSSA